MAPAATEGQVDCDMSHFCVSSFSALIKGQGYILVLPSRASELSLSIALRGIRMSVHVLKKFQRVVLT